MTSACAASILCTLSGNGNYTFSTRLNGYHIDLKKVKINLINSSGWALFKAELMVKSIICIGDIIQGRFKVPDNRLIIIRININISSMLSPRLGLRSGELLLTSVSFIAQLLLLSNTQSGTLL